MLFTRQRHGLLNGGFIHYGNNMTEQTPIPPAELELFNKLKDLEVIFDVGARTDIEYYNLLPNSEHHIFEPNPVFFKELVDKAKDKSNIFLNNYGLGDRFEELTYDPSSQSFMFYVSNPKLPIKTLNWYVEENKIDKIDFLKIDTEGWDYRVLTGGLKIVPHTRFIQYEHWKDKAIFHYLLGYEFDMEYIGYRNVLCMNRRLVSKIDRKELSKFIKEKGYKNLK